MPELPPTNPADGSDRTSPYSGSRPAAPDGIRPGLLIAGKYKLLEAIGEGGMGAVWLAQQVEPVRRHVAVKLIRSGMDSKSVVARFEAERQALSMMDHPNIARVFDVGTADDGRPFFAMELVKGTPITDFCDERKLTPRERLELFVPVCLAIQHAHQKGIIHRDIKPSNVLVSLHDDKPVPKVIDFGVAKATGFSLTEKTLHTGFEQVVGTPAYMSPEQATFNQLDIDTRSDVYSLGVLLYELLTGTTPIERQRFRQAALLEMLRVVREEEPPRPSARLSSTQTKASIAAQRGTEPARLTRELRTELDWVVMKSLEKDRARRYDSASHFASDVQRYLSGEPVHAHPPSAGYRVRKFVRKHRLGVAATIGAVALAGAGTLGVAFGMVERAERLGAQERAEIEQRAERHERELADELRRTRAGRSFQAAIERAERALAADDIAGADLFLQEAERVRPEAGDDAPQDRLTRRRREWELLKRLDEVDRHWWTPLDGRTLRADEILARMREAFRGGGLDWDAESPEAVARVIGEFVIRDRILAAMDILHLRQPGPRLAKCLQAADPDEYRVAVRDASQDPARAAELANWPDALVQPPRFAIRLGWAGSDDARKREIVDAAIRQHPADFNLLMTRASLNFFHDIDRVPEREKWYRAALAVRSDNPATRVGFAQTLLQREGDHEEAVYQLREAIRLDPKYRWARTSLSHALYTSGRSAEAVGILEAMLRENPDDGNVLSRLGGAYHTLGDDVRANAAWRKAVQLNPRDYVTRNNLAYFSCLQTRGETDEAIRLLEEALRIEPRFVTPKFHIMTAERFKKVRTRLPGILAGTDVIAPGEVLEVAEYCERPFARHYLLAVDCYRREIRRAPVPIGLPLQENDDMYYRAARCAVLAAAGADVESARIDLDDWRYLHDLARRWLQSRLRTMHQHARDPQKLHRIRAYLGEWRRDRDLATVRDAEWLERMPETDRLAWEQVWFDVDTVVAATQRRLPPAPPPRVSTARAE